MLERVKKTSIRRTQAYARLIKGIKQDQATRHLTCPRSSGASKQRTSAAGCLAKTRLRICKSCRSACTFKQTTNHTHTGKLEENRRPLPPPHPEVDSRAFDRTNLVYVHALYIFSATRVHFSQHFVCCERKKSTKRTDPAAKRNCSTVYTSLET